MVAQVKNFPKKIANLTCTILNGATTSDAISLGGTTPVVIEMPAAITGTTLTFVGSIDDGTTYCAISNSIGVITYTVAASGSYVLSPSSFIGYDKIKLVMSAQGADRTIKVKPFAV